MRSALSLPTAGSELLLGCGATMAQRFPPYSARRPPEREREAWFRERVRAHADGCTETRLGGRYDGKRTAGESRESARESAREKRE